MNQKEMTLLFAYIYNNRTRLEEEKKQLQTNVRYRDIDSVDCLELLLASERLASERLDTFLQVTTDIRHLLGFYTDDDKKTGG